jgi:flagellar basal body-associated protein FliL
MWIIFFMLMGVFVVAVMAVTLWGLSKEPKTEAPVEDLPKTLPEDKHRADPAEVKGEGERNEEKVGAA